ncbi:MAG TPA: hypothetical protein VGZ00_00220 [Candidatus Baltobacteraceae bacterium]|nr:hypothetical protein [Candidatus Baltobacteraceae bacterium]
MNARLSLAMLSLSAVIACSGTSATPPTSVQRSYNGTASVGDFLTIIVDSAAHTISYVNRSNSDSGTVPYTVNSDGTYSLNDPTGNLVTAYEIPNYAMIIQATKTGPTHNTVSLVTAVESGQISMATWSGHTYNYMQFRTAAGGLEVGSVSVLTAGGVSGKSYWPDGAMNGSGAFNTLSSSILSTPPVADPSGTFLTAPDQGGTTDYIFGTANGQFLVDTQNGAILGFQQALSKNLDPSVAGTYTATLYQKTGANTGMGNIETGTPSLTNATITIDAAGNAVIKDSHATTLASGVLAAVADTNYLEGVGKLTDPCFGMFTFRTTTASSQEDVFMTFQGRAALLSSFTRPLVSGPGSTYDYFYGVGLH